MKPCQGSRPVLLAMAAVICCSCFGSISQTCRYRFVFTLSNADTTACLVSFLDRTTDECSLVYCPQGPVVIGPGGCHTDSLLMEWVAHDLWGCTYDVFIDRQYGDTAGVLAIAQNDPGRSREFFLMPSNFQDTTIRDPCGMTNVYYDTIGVWGEN